MTLPISLTLLSLLLLRTWGYTRCLVLWIWWLYLLCLSRHGALLRLLRNDVSADCSRLTHQADCYNNAGWVHERPEKYRTLRRSRDARPPDCFKASGQRTERDTLSADRVHQVLSTSQHNLPAPRSSFVGREQEMLEVKRELEMTRLLTLTGVGGSGKTRLALEVARDLVDTYPDGVWLVELAPLSEEELVAPLSEKALVPKAVAEAWEVPERPGELLADTLAEVLRDEELLLVLDNCEHLLEATTRLADSLLDSCPRLRVLATSREALNVEGEIRWLVPPLSVPGPRLSSTVAELEGAESTQLFLARALNRDPSF